MLNQIYYIHNVAVLPKDPIHWYYRFAVRALYILCLGISCSVANITWYLFISPLSGQFIYQASHSFPDKENESGTISISPYSCQSNLDYNSHCRRAHFHSPFPVYVYPCVYFFNHSLWYVFLVSFAWNCLILVSNALFVIFIIVIACYCLVKYRSIWTLQESVILRSVYRRTIIFIIFHLLLFFVAVFALIESRLSQTDTDIALGSISLFLLHLTNSDAFYLDCAWANLLRILFLIRREIYRLLYWSHGACVHYHYFVSHFPSLLWLTFSGPRLLSLQLHRVAEKLIKTSIPLRQRENQSLRTLLIMNHFQRMRLEVFRCVMARWYAFELIFVRLIDHWSHWIPPAQMRRIIIPMLCYSLTTISKWGNSKLTFEMPTPLQPSSKNFQDVCR